jgi:leucyl aminopeptidase
MFITLSFLFASAFAETPSSRLILLPGHADPVPMSIADVEALQRSYHQAGRCGGVMDVTDTWSVLKDATPLRTPLLDFRSIEAPRHADQVLPRLSKLELSSLRNTVSTLSDFETRYYLSPKGVQASAWIEKAFQSAARGRTDIQVTNYRHRFAQPSVIATIQGTQKPDEIVILGAHMDSISPSPMRLAPGADDDASGIATILEIFRVLAHSDFRPARTLQFMAYAGEEAGLLGSLDLAALYRKQKRKVVAVLQFDMTMYAGKSRTLNFITDHTNQALTRFLSMLQDAYVKKPWKMSTCDYACSDHASWNKAGYASAFPTEANMQEMLPTIHTSRDVLEEIEVAYGLQFAQLGLAAAIELGLP